MTTNPWLYVGRHRADKPQLTRPPHHTFMPRARCGMSDMYECEVEGCTWRNPDWRYGFADAGASWASHMAEHGTSSDE